MIVVGELDGAFRRQCPVVVPGAGTAAEIHQIKFAAFLEDASLGRGQPGARGGPQCGERRAVAADDAQAVSNRQGIQFGMRQGPQDEAHGFGSAQGQFDGFPGPAAAQGFVQGDRILQALMLDLEQRLFGR